MASSDHLSFNQYCLKGRIPHLRTLCPPMQTTGDTFSIPRIIWWSWIRTSQRTLNLFWYPSNVKVWAFSRWVAWTWGWLQLDLWAEEGWDLSVWWKESRQQMWWGVKSHAALMQRHLKRFIDHFIDLNSWGRAKIKLDTEMTFTRASPPMDRDFFPRLYVPVCMRELFTIEGEEAIPHLVRMCIWKFLSLQPAPLSSQRCAIYFMCVCWRVTECCT